MSDDQLCLSEAYEIIQDFVYIRDNPPGEVTEDVKKAARFIIENQRHLPDFLAEKFCIAICCELELEIQRKCAWFLVSDMLIGSFSWITHLSGYSVEKALCKAGFIPEGYCSDAELRLERIMFGSVDVMKAIIEKYDLPTFRLHPDKILTSKEKEEKQWFNICYRGCWGTRTAL